MKKRKGRKGRENRIAGSHDSIASALLVLSFLQVATHRGSCPVYSPCFFWALLQKHDEPRRNGRPMPFFRIRSRTIGEPLTGQGKKACVQVPCKRGYPKKTNVPFLASRNFKGMPFAEVRLASTKTNDTDMIVCEETTESILYLDSPETPINMI